MVHSVSECDSKECMKTVNFDVCKKPLKLVGYYSNVDPQNLCRFCNQHTYIYQSWNVGKCWSCDGAIELVSMPSNKSQVCLTQTRAISFISTQTSLIINRLLLHKTPYVLHLLQMYVLSNLYLWRLTLPHLGNRSHKIAGLKQKIYYRPPDSL